MKLEAKMVHVPAAKPILLSELPMWTEAEVEFQGCSYIRFHGSDGYAWDATVMREWQQASNYTVERVLGPLPSGNPPLAKAPESPRLTLGALPRFEFAEVEWSGIGETERGIRCHDGHGWVFGINCQDKLFRTGEDPNEYLVIGDRWRLEIEVTGESE